MLRSLEFAYTCSLFSPGDNAGVGGYAVLLCEPFASPRTGVSIPYDTISNTVSTIANRDKTGFKRFYAKLEYQRKSLSKIMANDAGLTGGADVPWSSSEHTIEYAAGIGDRDLRLMLSISGMRMRIVGITLRVEAPNGENNDPIVINEATGKAADEGLMRSIHKHKDSAFYFLPTNTKTAKIERAMRSRFHGLKGKVSVERGILRVRVKNDSILYPIQKEKLVQAHVAIAGLTPREPKSKPTESACVLS